MTQPDAMKLLREKVAEHGQATVGRMLGYSNGSGVCQVLKGEYKGAPDEMLKRVVEIFGGLTVKCPVLDDIPLSQCATERKKQYAASNHQQVALFKACQSCPQNGGKP